MQEIVLPSDIYTPDTDPASAWQSLQEQTADARAKRTDIVGRLALEEQATGQSGWRERVQNRLTVDGHEPVGTKVISDAAKIFQLFRLSEAQGGFGWPRERIAEHQPGRLRVFAQNAEWAARNREAVEEMIASGRNENAMRKEIREAKLREEIAANGGELPEQEEWVNLSARLDPSQARFVEATLAAMRVKKEQEGETFSERKGVALGQVLVAMCAEWMYASTTYEDGDGGEMVIGNITFFDPEIRAEMEAANAQESAEVEAAD